MTRRVFHAEDLDAVAAAPLARAAHAATAVTSDDAEAQRIRTLLCALRPDYPDPYEPMPAGGQTTGIMRVSPSRAPWDIDAPRGFGAPAGAMLDAAAQARTAGAAEVMARIAALPADAAAVLRWVRREASLAKGLRGLWHDAGMHFASAEQTAAWADLTVRRGFAPAHGRRLVLAAATAWERAG